MAGPTQRERLFTAANGQPAGVIRDGVLHLTKKTSEAHFIHFPVDSIGIDKQAWDARHEEIDQLVCECPVRGTTYRISKERFLTYRNHQIRSHQGCGDQYVCALFYWTDDSKAQAEPTLF